MKIIKLAIFISVPLFILSADKWDEKLFFRGWDKTGIRAGKAFLNDRRVFATLTVNSPDSIKLFIDRDNYGNGPFKDLILPVGKHDIRIEHNDKEFQKIILIKKGSNNLLFKNNRVQITYSKRDKFYGRIKVICNRKAAVYRKFFRGFKHVGFTPYTWEGNGPMAGSFRLKFGNRFTREMSTSVRPYTERVFVYRASRRRLSFKKLKTYIIFPDGKRKRVNLRKRRRKVTALSVTSYPRGIVYLNEKNIGRTPFFGKFVKPGRHVLKVVSLDKKSFYKKRFSFSSSGNLVLDINLIEDGKGAIGIYSYPRGKVYINNICYGYGNRRISLAPGKYQAKVVDPRFRSVVYNTSAAPKEYFFHNWIVSQKA